MRLFELFAQTYPYRTTVASGVFNASADLDDGTILSFQADDRGYGWFVSFSRGGTMKISGKGDAMKIFSTVLAMMADFIQEINPSNVVFSADEISRRKLYAAMTKRILKKHPDYYWYHPHSDEYDMADTTFWLKKK